jgi:hypothetical protein
MTCVKDFELELCFVTENSKLSNLKPVQIYKNNTYLSKIIAYFYVIIKYGTDNVIWVDETVFDMLREFFPDPIKLLRKQDMPKDGAQGWTITEIDSSNTSVAKYSEGEIMMPVYVPENSTIVYNIHQINADKIEYTNEYIMGAVNYFNCIIRSQTSGIKRVLWKDPVISSTRLHDANYDKMLCLYLAARYLSVFQMYFPAKDSLTTLAMCLRFCDILESNTSKISTQLGPAITGNIEIRHFTVKMLQLLAVPENFIPAETSPTTANIPNNLIKRDLSSILIFLNTGGSITSTSTDHIYITGYKDYTFIDTLSKLYPKATFKIWEPTVKVVTGGNVFHEKIALTPDKIKNYKDKNPLILISNLKNNDALLKYFNGAAMVVSGSTSFEPSFTFVSCYVNPSISSGYIVVGSNVSLSRSKLTENKNKLKFYGEYIESHYRDPKKWAYYINDTSTTYTFDDALMEYLLLLSAGKKVD